MTEFSAQAVVDIKSVGDVDVGDDVEEEFAAAVQPDVTVETPTGTGLSGGSSGTDGIGEDLLDFAAAQVNLLDEIADSLGQSAFDAARRGGGGGGGGLPLPPGAGRLAAGGVGLTGLAGGGLAAALGGGGVALSAMLGDRLTEGGEIDLTNLLYGGADNDDSVLNQPDSGAENGYEDGESVLGFIADRFGQRGGAGNDIAELNSTLQNIDLGSQLETAASNAQDELSSISLNIDDSRLPKLELPSEADVPSLGLPSEADIPSLSLPSEADVPSLGLPSEADIPDLGLAEDLDPPTLDLPTEIPELGVSDLPDIEIGDLSALRSTLSEIPGVSFNGDDGESNEINATPRPAFQAVATAGGDPDSDSRDQNSSQNQINADPTVETNVEVTGDEIGRQIEEAVRDELKRSVPDDRELERLVSEQVEDIFDGLR